MKASEFDRMFDDGEDISHLIDWKAGRRPGLEAKRVNVDFPNWMVEKLDREYALGTRSSPNPDEGKTKVTDLALEYGIMTRYTSFVAVEQRVINVGGQQRTVHVPVEMASGVSR